MLTANRPVPSMLSEGAAEPLPDRPQRWEQTIYAVSLLVTGILFYVSFVPRCVDFNWSDDDFTGWDYSLANRITGGHKLYDPGIHTPIPPLSYVIVKFVGLGHPSWTTEMAVIVVCQIAVALLFAFGAAKAFGRWPAFVGALAGLGFFAGFTKTIAYDAVAQLFAVIAALGIAAHVEAQRDGNARNIWRSASVAGLGCMGAVLAKQSLGVFMLPGVALALALLGRGSPLERIKPVALASAAWFVLISLVMSPWVNLWGMIAVGILGGAETKGGSGHLVTVLSIFLNYGLSTVLVFGGLVSFVVFAVVTGVRQWRGENTKSDLRRDAHRTFGITVLAALCTALVLLGFALGLPWTAASVPGAPQLVDFLEGFGDRYGPILMWGALYLSFTNAVLPRRSDAPGALQARAITIVFIFAAVGMTLSVLEFRWTFDNNPLIMSSIALVQAFVGGLTRQLRARGLIVAAVAALFVVAGWSASRGHFMWTYAATDPSPQFPEINGALIRPDIAPWRRAVQDVKAWTRPTETALVLPEDPHTESLFERPRPPFRSGVMFVDTLQAVDEVADEKTLARQPPAVLIIAPVKAWRPWSAYLRRHSPLEHLIDWVTGSLIPAKYYLAAEYDLPPAQWLQFGDTMQLYRLRKPAPPQATIPPPQPAAPAWLAPAQGNAAYLKDDGRGTPRVTLCASPSAYAKFAGSGIRQDCREYARGTAVRVGRARGTFELDGTTTALYDVADAGGKALGVIDLDRLRPVVPANTVLMARARGSTLPSFWLTRSLSGEAAQRAPGMDSGAEPLPPNALVEVLEQAAYDNDADLYVRVLTGAERGEMGWMNGLSLPYSGVSADRFAAPAGTGS